MPIIKVRRLWAAIEMAIVQPHDDTWRGGNPRYSVSHRSKRLKMRFI